MSKFISSHFKVMLRKLHNAEHFEFFANGIIAGLQSLIASVASLAGIFDALKIVFQKEDAMFKLSQASILTSDITALHEKRLALFSFFWHYVTIFKYLGDTAKALAAEKLLFLKNTYKDLPTAAYQDVSGLMTNFLQDCESNAWKPYIQLTGLSFLVTQMATDNEAFRDLYRERSIDQEHVAGMGKLAEIRVDMDNAFDAFVDAVNVAWQANEIGAKDPAVRAALISAREIITAAIHQAELNLAHRGRHKKQDDKTDDGTQTTDPANPGGTPGTTPGTQQPNTDRPEAHDTTQNPTDEPHHLDPGEHPFAGE
ncbi:MAG: DUF6261 family protein [Tannerellaceae bacterium]|nr:DUF6261 family protein [Tannerellaceae bacterium]